MRFAELGAKASALPVNKPETYDAHAAALGAFYKHIMRSANAGMMETYLAQQMLYRATIGGIDLKKNPELQPGVKDSVWSGTPYTKAEIDNFWKETVAYYNAPSVEMKDYDLSDLVPVEWKNVTLVGMEDDKMPWVITQGGSAAYGMYSLRGEPLKVQLKWNYPGPRNWTPKDKTDTVVLKGTAFTEKDSNNETIELKVPKSGYYFFEAVDTGGWLTVTVLGNQIASSDMKRNGWPGKYGGTVPTFFYVPKDLKNLSIYSGAALLKLLGPDGKVVFEKPDAAGEWTIVPVPAGLDGTVWQFAAGFSASALGNAPRIMATSPSRLMIPRNVAEKDGLTIRR